MRTATRNIIAASVIASAVAAVVGVTLWRRHQASVQSPSGAMASMPGMEMPGMAMPTKGSVTLTPTQARDLRVTFGTVDMRSLAADVRATGIVTFDETRIAQVTPKFSGFAEHVYVNATGQPVRRGQPLLDVYSPDLVAAQQELLLAVQLQNNIGRSTVPGVPGATTDLVGAAKRRLELWDISEQQIDEILRTGRIRRALTLYSPASGVVTDKRVVEGQSVMAGQALYTIVDLADVWIDVQLREADAAIAHIGSGADIEITGLPGQTFKGQVSYVYPTLDTASRALRARIVVSNTGSLLKPGMYATVRLHAPSRTALTVPTSAVLRTGTRNVVFVDMGGGQLMPVEVEIGRVAGDYTEVFGGLEPGQRVVTSAQFLLDSESNLAEVMRSMISQMPSERR
jgi:membrane fusion protein, copper/silver efflux system